MSKSPLSPIEWEKLQAILPRGSYVKGRVVSVHPFGVFVDIGLDPRIPVLLEIIHFKIRQDDPEHRISFPEDYPAVGDEIEARILAYSMKPHDIRLTQFSHLEWIHSQWLKESQEPSDDSGGTV
jgi:ribosomal protein S1